MRGHAILTAAAGKADPERAVAMLAEAANACFYAGNPAEMLVVAERARAMLPADASPRASFLAGITVGMARILGGDAAAGTEAVHEAIKLAERTPSLREDLELMPWLAIGPLFMRETGAGRSLLEGALRTARDKAAVGALPFLLNLIARDQAATDRWAVAEATYLEAIDLARESGRRESRAGLGAGRPGVAAGTPWPGAGVQRSGGRGAAAVPRTRHPAARDLGHGGPRWTWNSASAMRPAPPPISSSSSGCWRNWRSPTPTCHRRRNSPRPTPGSAATTRRGRWPPRSRPRRRRKGSRGRWPGRCAARACWRRTPRFSRTVRSGTTPARTDPGRVRDRPDPAGLRRAPAAGQEPGAGTGATPCRAGHLRASRGRPVGRPGQRRTRGDRRNPDAARPGNDRRTDTTGTADRARPCGREDDAGNRLGDVPEPQDRGVRLRHVYQKLGIHSRDKLARALASEGR